MDTNEAIREATGLTRREMMETGLSAPMHLAESHLLVHGGRVRRPTASVSGAAAKRARKQTLLLQCLLGSGETARASEHASEGSRQPDMTRRCQQVSGDQRSKK
jgi:hypothetical protein